LGAIYVPWLVVAFVLFGIIDLSVMRTLDWANVRNYFFKSYGLTWWLAPLNLLADLVTWSRPKFISFENLPAECRNEISGVTEGFDHQEFIDKLALKVKDKPKAMLFYKWYGHNINTSIEMPLFHKPYKYVKTIGISVFNNHSSIGRHFGPLRLTHRVLYNLNPRQSNDIYIDVDGDRHYWHDDRMLIFDDTYIHQSINESDGARYVMFVDIIRNSPHPAVHRLLELLVGLVSVVAFRAHKSFYHVWSFVN
jgi:beta-hydroxylase